MGESVSNEETTQHFQAAVTRVLGLVINSLYSNKEIFLRELISNASDALDKLRFRAISEPALLDETPLAIRVAADEEAGTITISDDGIGMDRDELVKNLGTVAHSGSQEFLEKLEEAQDQPSIIGQFGVGFYSAYLVADRVEVVSRGVEAERAWRWSSDGKETFTVTPASRATRGTDVILHLKPDQKDFLKTWTLKDLIKRFSDYIDHSIEVRVERTVDGAKDVSWERANAAAALWRRSKTDITEEQYQEFYKHLTHDWEPPMAWSHFRIEGTQMFTGLLFVPGRPPFDLFSPDTSHGVRLHVKRVFIMDDCEELLPRWLRMVRGVVDSEDLPLNVSRELLQDSRVVRVIRKQVVKHALEMIEQILSGDDAAAFWTRYGAVLKEGLHFDAEHRDKLAQLVRFSSTTSDGLVSLSDYVGRMKDDQEAIYYAIGATRQMVENAPHLEALKKHGYEVLLMTDAIDEFAVQSLREFDGKPLASVMDAELDLAGSDAPEESDGATVTDLLARVRVVLQDRVSEVRVSKRLVDSPACLVLPEGGLPPYLERLMRLQNADLPKQKRVLEINAGHPIVAALSELHARDADSERVREWIELLYDQSLLAEGSPVEDPARMVRAISDLLARAATAATAETAT
jgi:molecular chaperone HtpG